MHFDFSLLITGSVYSDCVIFYGDSIKRSARIATVYRFKSSHGDCLSVCVCVCLRPQSLSTAPFDRAQWRTTTCQSATASFEESRVVELDRKRAARKQQVIDTTGTVWPCDRCSRTYSSRIALFAHRRTHPSVTQSVVFDDALRLRVSVSVGHNRQLC